MEEEEISLLEYNRLRVRTQLLLYSIWYGMIYKKKKKTIVLRFWLHNNNNMRLE